MDRRVFSYFALTWLTTLVKQGVYFLLSYKEPVVVCTGAGQRVEVLDLLPTQGQETVDVPVYLGASKQVSARLIARKMSEEVVKRRREQLKEHAHKQCKPISPRQWELVQWVIVLTNVPPGLLAAGEAMAVLRARWQIELLWKLWKDLGKVDEWQTANPARILCELYAKLLGMLVQHWLLLLSCWDDPHRSLVGAAEAHARSGADVGPRLDRSSAIGQGSAPHQGRPAWWLFHSQASNALEYLSSPSQAA